MGRECANGRMGLLAPVASRLMTARKLVIATTAALSASLIGSAAASALPGVLTETRKANDFSVRPPVIGYTGDGTGYFGGNTESPKPFGRLHWTKWNNREASGTGSAWLNDCDPSCAEGDFFPYRLRLHLSVVSHGHFTHMTGKYTLDGRRRTVRRKLTSYDGIYSWG